MIAQVETALRSGCAWGAWWHLPAAILGTYLAILAHELTHAVLMWPVAEDVQIQADSWLMADLRVESTMYDEEWRHTWADLAGIAPLLIGLGIVSYWWLLGAWPDTSILGIGAYNAVLWYGFLGGLSDYSREHSVARGAGERQPEPAAVRALPDGGQAFVANQQRLINAALLAYVAALLGIIYQQACYGQVAATASALANLALLLFVAAIGLLLIRLDQFTDKELGG